MKSEEWCVSVGLGGVRGCGTCPPYRAVGGGGSGTAWGSELELLGTSITGGAANRRRPPPKMVGGLEGLPD
ncbi:hypothetical protein V6N12_045249 [Hibiscus sabdariffa]|uniref:Uncharacterized protein n=1 Tax=Hibiscus sabdariffa TaxID=183260 RepID=A0ABR2G2U0_9ROSI